MWAWSHRTRGGRPEWVAVTPGHIRDTDERHLFITDKGEPAYLSPKWYISKMRLRARAQKSASKGKARGTFNPKYPHIISLTLWQQLDGCATPVCYFRVILMHVMYLQRRDRACGHCGHSLRGVTSVLRRLACGMP